MPTVPISHLLITMDRGALKSEMMTEKGPSRVTNTAQRISTSAEPKILVVAKGYLMIPECNEPKRNYLYSDTFSCYMINLFVTLDEQPCIPAGQLTPMKAFRLTSVAPQLTLSDILYEGVTYPCICFHCLSTTSKP